MRMFNLGRIQSGVKKWRNGNQDDPADKDSSKNRTWFLAELNVSQSEPRARWRTPFIAIQAGPKRNQSKSRTSQKTRKKLSGEFGRSDKNRRSWRPNARWTIRRGDRRMRSTTTTTTTTTTNRATEKAPSPAPLASNSRRAALQLPRVLKVETTRYENKMRRVRVPLLAIGHRLRSLRELPELGGSRVEILRNGNGWPMTFARENDCSPSLAISRNCPPAFFIMEFHGEFYDVRTCWLQALQLVSEV